MMGRTVRIAAISILALAGAWLLLGWDDTDTADAAHTPCTAINHNECLGHAELRITVAGAGVARWCVREAGAASVCVNDAMDRPWTMDAGDCIDLEAQSSEQAGYEANVVVFQVRYGATATVVREYVNGANPWGVTATVYTFCSTSDGTVSGSPRAGTYSLYVRVQRTGAINSFNIDTSGDLTSCAAGGTCTRTRGWLRGEIEVADCTRNAYPSGSTFAYGASGDEQVTLTATGTQRYADANLETVRVKSLRNSNGATIETGSTQEMNAGSVVQSFTIDNTYDGAATAYDCELEIVGVGTVTGLPWTVCASTGHGSGVTCTAGATVARKTNVFSADPRIIYDSDGTGTFAAADDTVISRTGSSTGPTASTFVRGETVYWETYVFNARGEKLSRSMTFAVRSAAPATENTQTLTPSSNKYSTTYVVGATDAQDAKKLRVTNTDQLHDSAGTVWTVSIGALQLDGNGVGTPDDTPVCTYSVYNRVESVTCEYYIMGASGPTPISGVSSAVKASDGTTENTQTLSPSSNKYTHTYTTASTDKATLDTTGDDHKFTVTASGSTINSVTRVFGLSRLYFVDAHIESDTTLNADDFPTEDANEDFTYTISNDLTYTTSGWCHVKGVRKDVNIDTGSNAVTRAYVDPTAATRQTQNTETGSDGWTATRLDQLASTPLGTWHFTCSVSHNGNTGSDDESFTVQVAGGTGGGFIGDPLRLDVSCKRCYAGDTVLFTFSLSNGDGSARTGYASLTYRVLNPSGSVVVDWTSTTELAFGVYTATYSLGSSPAAGSWIVQGRTADADPVGSGNTFLVANDFANVITAVNNARDRVVDHVDYTSGRVNLTRGDIAALKTDFYSAWTRLNTTCQKTTSADCEGLQVTVEYRSGQTNGYVNSTSATQIALLNTVHDHIDTHFEQTWDQIAMFEGNMTILLEGISCDVGGNCTFNVDNEPVLAALEAQEMRVPGLDTAESWSLLIFLAILGLALYHGWMAVFFGGSWGAISSLVGAIGGWGELYLWVAQGFVFVIIGAWLEVFVDYENTRFFKWVESRKTRT